MVVRAERATQLGKDISTPLDEPLLTALRARPEIGLAQPRMDVAVPATVLAELGGAATPLEAGGYIDGIDPRGMPASFADREARDIAPRPACAAAACADPDRYCDDADHTCHLRVPVLLSPAMVELYNAQVAPARGLAPIADPAAYLASHAVRFTLDLGASTIAGAPASAHPHRIEAVVVGIDAAARPVGFTVPLPYARAWNLAFGGEAKVTAIDVRVRPSAELTRWLADRKLVLEPR